MSSEPTQERSRLHPLSLPFSMLTHLKGFLVPLFLVIAFSKNLEWEAWTFVLLVPLFFFETWRYLTLRYGITEGELIVTEGVLFREERHIPLARIQTVDSTQNLLQRVFGVVEVRVETAGSAKPEAHLKVLSVEARDALRRGIFSGKAATGGPPEESPASDSEDDGLPREHEELHRVGALELSLLGLNLGRGLALLGIFFGLAGQLGFFDELKLGRAVKLVHDLLSGVAESGVWAELLIEFALAAGLVVLVFLLSVGSVWVRLFDFRLERRGDEFRTQCGLFTRHATTIPKGRVQFVSIQAPLTLRLLGRALVKVRTAGGRAQGDKTSVTRQWLIPVMREEDVPALVREFVPGYVPARLAWHPIAAGGRGRLLRRATVLGLVIHAPLLLVWSSWGALVLAVSLPAVLTLFWALAWLRAKRLAWSDTGDAFLIRDGVLNERIALVPRDRVQSVSVVTNPFDRRARMARLFVDTAGAHIGHHAHLAYLEAEVARGLADDLVERAEAFPNLPSQVRF
jgi:putative membrane protein